MSKQTVEDVLRELNEIEANREKVLKQIKAYNDIYFMDIPAPTPPGWDTNDLRHFIDPTGHNKVKGVSDLVASTEPIISVTGKGDTSRVENGLKSMWRAINARRRTAIEKDVALAAALYAEVALVYKDVAVLEEGATSNIHKRRLEKLKKKTPFTVDIVNAEFIYPSFGADGELDMFFELYQAKGRKVKQQWEGVEGANTEQLDDDTDYDIWDGYTLTHRLVAVKGQEESAPIIYEEHGLSEFPVSLTYANGSELFVDEEKKRRPLLFAYEKSGAFDSTTLLLSAGMTHTLATGFGPVFVGEPDPNQDFSFRVDNQGPIRTVVPEGGKIKETRMESFDKSAMELYGLVSNISEESTMHGQALGAPMQGKQAYSTVSLLSQSGRLPLASIQACAERSLERIMTLMLDDIKENNPSAELADEHKNLLTSQDIERLGDYEVQVKLDVKLSQDAFREAQVAGQLRGLIPEETIRQEILHITDEEEAVRKIIKEQARAEMVKAMMGQSIQEMMQMVGQIQGAGNQVSGNQGAAGNQVSGNQVSGNQGAGGQIPPEIMAQLQAVLPPEQLQQIVAGVESGQITPEQLMQLVAQIQAQGASTVPRQPAMQGEQVVQGNPMAAMAGGGRMPQTEPTNTEQIG